jgi:spore coat polysaccharide biosynthesis protein SpsF
VILSTPTEDLDYYNEKLGRYDLIKTAGYSDDPLARMYFAAKNNKVDIIIRVTHDKIFVDENTIFKAINTFREKNLDYLYSSKFTDGSGFEIISFSALEKAHNAYKKVEHISYATLPLVGITARYMMQ